MMATFCSSLRKRPAWASVTMVLQQNEQFNFKESRLNTHDIALPFGDNDDHCDVYRFVLLSPADVKLPETKSRLQRLYFLDGGKNVAIIFLLTDLEGGNTMEAFESLQIKALDDFDMPIVPLSSTNELPATLQRFMDGRADAKSSRARECAVVRELLPYCTTEKKLSERATYFLSDISTSLSDLVDRIATAEGRDVIATLLGEEDAAGIFAFFADELAGSN